MKNAVAPSNANGIDCASLTVLVQHPSLWFHDGDVVLQTGTTVFCVHRSKLCHKSENFAILFAAHSSVDTYAGLPLVRLDDSPHELADLLEVLYRG